jgi:hypothetical protein
MISFIVHKLSVYALVHKDSKTAACQFWVFYFKINVKIFLLLFKYGPKLFKSRNQIPIFPSRYYKGFVHANGDAIQVHAAYIYDIYTLYSDRLYVFDRKQTQKVVWRELICRDTTVFYITWNNWDGEFSIFHCFMFWN